MSTEISELNVWTKNIEVWRRRACREGELPEVFALIMF